MGLIPDVPYGYDEIVETFGDLSPMIEDDGRISPAEEATFLTTIKLNFPMIYAYDTSTTIRRIRCHKLMADIFTEVFEEIASRGLDEYCKEYGGCYVFRPMRGGKKLSTHSWGIAIDINPRTNQMGTVGDINRDLVKVFKDYGFTWGGDWKRIDYQHFQYAKGY